MGDAVGAVPCDPGIRSLQLLYISSQLPFRTETFVSAEIESLRRQGYVVDHFPLRGGPVLGVVRATGRTSRVKLLRGLIVGVRLAPRVFCELLRALSRDVRRGPRAFSRVIFSLVQASILAVWLEASEDAHTPRWIHAHFLGRPLEVAVVVQRLAPDGVLGVSATAHAADALAPRSPSSTRRLLSSTQLVVGASSAVATAVADTCGWERSDVPVVRCGVSTPSTSIGRLPSNRLRILSVGRLVPKKGFDDAVAAGHLLANEGHLFRWDFVGDGPMRGELESRASDLTAHGLVRWLGHLEHLEVLELMSASYDVFVLPCKRSSDGEVDGIPVVLMEAMARLLPVVTCEVGGIGELIRHRETGFFVAESSPSQIAGQLLEIARLGPRLAPVVAAARDHVAKYFDVDVEAERLISLIADRIATRPTSTGNMATSCPAQ